MKIIAFGASPSKNSINKKLATYAAGLFEDAVVEVLDLNDYQMPLFSVDIEKIVGHHELAYAFLNKIQTADFLVVSMAENNSNYSAAFKNLFDWCSRITGKVFQNKPMLLMATSDGKRGGQNVLKISTEHLPRYGADIKGVFSLPSFYENFDEEKGIISNPEFDAELKEIVKNIAL